LEWEGGGRIALGGETRGESRQQRPGEKEKKQNLGGAEKKGAE